MEKFKKLNLPKSHRLQHSDSAPCRIKWFCSVEGSDIYYLHDDLHIYYGATTEEQTEESYHIGYFDSEEEALEA